LTSIVFVAALWMTALVAAPAAASTGRGGLGFSAVVYAAGSMICHQRPERSFHLHGAQLPVCARCAGLYAGGLIGAIAWVAATGVRRLPSQPLRRVSPVTVRRAMMLLALPTIVSVAASALGWWDSNNVRALLAVPLGCGIGALVCAVAAGDLR